MRDNNIQLEGLAGVVKRLSEDAKISFLAVDAAVKDSADESTLSYMRRMYARAVIAFLDGVTYRLMFHAYAARFRPETMLTADEIQRLERYYDFDEDKEAQTTLSKSQMPENIRFAFRTFARIHYSDYVLPNTQRVDAHQRDCAPERHTALSQSSRSTGSVRREHGDIGPGSEVVLTASGRPLQRNPRLCHREN